jgi:hypothetical protein
VQHQLAHPRDRLGRRRPPAEVHLTGDAAH